MRTLEQVLEDHGPLPLYDASGKLAELEQVQKEDIHKIAHWGRALGDLPVGYGKTAIATVASLMLQPDTTVVLVPPILIVQWVKWLKSIRDIGTVVAWEGPPAKRLALDVHSNWLVMSYGVFRNDIDYLRKHLKNSNLYVIVDEAQHCKSYKSALFKGVSTLSAGQHLLEMSGTIMSNVGDAYSYIKLTNPAAYASHAQFENVHVAKRDFFDQPIEWTNLDLLQTNLNHRRVYRSKEEVHASLPKARFIPVYYDLPKEHMKLYRQLMEQQLLLLDDGSKIDATTAQKLYHAAQQIITNWGVFAGDDTKKSLVFDLIDNVCDEINLGGQMQVDVTKPAVPASKLILWTQYKMTSRAVQQHMSERLALTGHKAVAAFSEVNSVKSVAAFLDDPLTVSLNAQPGSAGAGLNPQHLCWECGFVETPTRTIAFVQSAGRIDRKGQRYNPNIRLFIARHTIQESLLANLLENDSLVQRASGSARGIKDLIFPG